MTGCGLLLSGLVVFAGLSGRAAGEVDPGTLKKHALEIDRQVAEFYRSRKLSVPEVADDATFLRRAFLVAIGRIPSSEEALFFLEIEDAGKREQLVDYLLKSPGFSSHMSNWAFDLLRVVDRNRGRSHNLPYRHWVREAMADNMPWDEFTTHLLAAEGNGWDPATAAVGYYTRDKGMPLDNLSNSMRIFLGTRMECAQCHDDPFGDTERFDFYQLAAFTHGQGFMAEGLLRPLYQEVRDARMERPQENRAMEVLWDQVIGMSLDGGGSGSISLPGDYQYRDGDPGEVVGARTPFGRTVRMSPRRSEHDGRRKLADWVVHRTDAQFAEVIANRMWKRVMGKGLYEPVDDYKPAAETPHPRMMALLASIMVDLDYDLKAFQHTLLLTRTFQFATNPEVSKVEAGDDFHGRKIQRLSAEQIWDSLVTLAVGDPDGKPRRGLDTRIHVGNRPVLVGTKDMVQLSREVLALKTREEMRAYFDEFVRATGDSRQNPRGRNEMAVMSSGGPSYGRGAMVRASELPSPAPRDHFLYLFGASDREVVEAASREPNVGQVLSLMNGVVQDKLVNDPDAHLYKCLEGAGSAEERIRRLYISILNRPPNEREMAWMTDELDARGGQGIRNVVAALVMSSEFLFLQ